MIRVGDRVYCAYKMLPVRERNSGEPERRFKLRLMKHAIWNTRGLKLVSRGNSGVLYYLEATKLIYFSSSRVSVVGAKSIRLSQPKTL